jgi:hypothetical protein
MLLPTPSRYRNGYPHATPMVVSHLSLIVTGTPSGGRPPFWAGQALCYPRHIPLLRA